ncbi:MAG: hypothetical protein C0614_05215 [Desulfuromonas sp.]|nr:MAG: hypothetical protein C0614_05215 [Desulfuromonas sp.]
MMDNHISSGEENMIPRRILVVDDEESIRFTFGVFLGDAGYAVDTAEDLATAVNRLETTRYDVLFLDILLGRDSGITVLEACRNINPHCSVIMVTGAPEIKTAADAVRLGAFDYVTKPVHQDELLRLAARGIEHKELLDQQETLNLRMMAVFKSIPEGILVFDRDQNLVEMNSAASNILGCEHQIVGQNLATLVARAECPALNILSDLIETRCTGEIFNFKTPNKQGTPLNMTVSMAPLTSGSGEENGLVLVLHDESLPVTNIVETGP